MGSEKLYFLRTFAAAMLPPQVVNFVAFFCMLLMSS